MQHPTQSPTDEIALIERSLAGDHQAYGELVVRYQRLVIGLCYRMLGTSEDAEDAAQEIFLRVYQRLASFQLDRRFSTWLLTIASNHCIDRLRRRKPTTPIDAMAYRLTSSLPDPVDVAIEGEQRDGIQRALDRLPEHYRAALVLRYWNDLSYDEICEVTGLTLATVKSRLHRARTMIADALAAEGITWTAEPSATDV